MEKIILKYSLAMVDYMDKLRLSGATWSFRPIQMDDGEWGVEVYDILTADELADIDLDAMEIQQLKTMLPKIRDLYYEVEETLSEYDEYDDDLDMTEEAFDELHEGLEGKLTIVEEQLEHACKRLGISFEDYITE